MARSWEPLLAPDVTWNAVSTPPGGWTFHTTCISHATHVPLDPLHTFNIQARSRGRGRGDSSPEEEEDGNEEDGDSRTILTFEKLMPRPHATNTRSFRTRSVVQRRRRNPIRFSRPKAGNFKRTLPLTRVSGANIKEKEVNRGGLNK